MFKTIEYDCWDRRNEPDTSQLKCFEEMYRQRDYIKLMRHYSTHV